MNTTYIIFFLSDSVNKLRKDMGKNTFKYIRGKRH